MSGEILIRFWDELGSTTLIETPLFVEKVISGEILIGFSAASGSTTLIRTPLLVSKAISGESF
jgi:hypothetical protein